MPALVAGVHAFMCRGIEGVDARNESAHDGSIRPDRALAGSVSSMTHWLAGLPPVLQAGIWMFFGGATGGLMNVIVRFASAEMHPFEVVFFRNLFSLMFMLPWLVRTSATTGMRTGKFGFYVLRAGVAFVSMLTWFYGINLVPLATAQALNFTAPLFATIMAALILKEQVRARRWSAIAIGFAGVLVVLRPFGPTDTNMLWILVSAATGAMGAITVKFLSRTESASAIVAWMVLLGTPMSLVPALFVWSWPSLMGLVWLVSLGLLGTLAHLSFARALGAADASVCAAFEFLRLPYAALLAWVFFSEPTDLFTWIGAAIIMSSTLYVAHREAQLSRRAPERVSGGRPATPSVH
jgi:drug/metabolite transporter (DMT)-like permease